MNVEAPNRTASEALQHAFEPAARIVIDALSPMAGGFAVKRTVGDVLIAEADIFADGHDELAAALLVRGECERSWSRMAMSPLVNDRWQGRAALDREGVWYFCVEAWFDDYGSFVGSLRKKRAAGQQLTLEAEEGRALIAAVHRHAHSPLRTALAAILDGWDGLTEEDRIAVLLAEETQSAMRAADERPFLTRSRTVRVEVDRPRAAFASWYEVFPRSLGREPQRHGTFRDVIDALPRIHDMGFDVLYMPPIHPIGTTNRKGRNNALRAADNDPGSPYAIGSEDGGHTSLHPQLGTLDDFHALVDAAAAHGMELALDFAIQMSPDHPWLREHPGWFQKRPDGSMKYVENPPKKYEDIVNPDFYADIAIWEALRDVVLFWVSHGIAIFRVDNPHTKPLPFWQWLIADVRAKHPDTIFLSEAFTRPKLMHRLAQVGFTQSYTYFTWRNTKQELIDYMRELGSPPVSDFFRPHFFVNTPDINPYYLQTGGRAGFLARAALAATLSGLWGVYSGFELCEAAPLPGREEYLDAEKYQLKQRDYRAPGNISNEIAQLNALRRREPHFHSHLGLTFYNAFNDHILYYGKAAPERNDRILVAVNLDPHHEQACHFEIPLWEWGLPDHETLDVEDLLHGFKFTWTGKIQHMRLSPTSPYCIWRILPQGSSIS